jgi:RNA polymerase sigma-70 factor, ECF subfamily
MAADDCRADPLLADLLRRAAAGDESAFAAVYGRFQHIVYRFARAMTGSAEAAEEVTQEVFVALIADLDRYDPARAAFSTYLYGIVRNLSRERLRRERRFLPLDAWRARGTADDGRADALQRLEGEETAAQVRRALQRLPSRHREVIVLCDLHGLSYADAAVVVESSVPAVRSRLHRARQLLRSRLARMIDSEVSRSPRPARCAI